MSYSCCLQTFSHLFPSTGIGTQEHPRHNLLGAKSCSWVQPNKLSMDWIRSHLHCAPHCVGPVLLNHVSCVLNWATIREDFSGSLSRPGLYLHRAGALPTPWSPVWEKENYFHRCHVYFQIYEMPRGNSSNMYLWNHIMAPHKITRSKKWLQKAATESIYMSEIIRSWMLQSSKEPSGMYLRMMIGICKEWGQVGGTQIVKENMVNLSLLQLLLSNN